MCAKLFCSRDFCMTTNANYIYFACTRQNSMTTSLEEVLAIHRFREGDLSLVCSREHRDEFTKRIKDWKAVGAALGFTREYLASIDNNFQSDEQKRTILLFQWSTRDGTEATYLNLAKLLFAGGQLDLLQELCKLVPRATPSIPAGQPHKHCRLIQISHKFTLVLLQRLLNQIISVTTSFYCPDLWLYTSWKFHQVSLNYVRPALFQSDHQPYSAFLSLIIHLDQPSSGDGSCEVEPSHTVEESRNQVVEWKLEPESAPDALHKSLLKSGTIIYEYYLFKGAGSIMEVVRLKILVCFTCREIFNF